MTTRLPSRPSPVSEEPWRREAACRGMDTHIFFPTDSSAAAYAPAKAVCSACPVREACLEYALAAGESEGVFGGLDPRERYRLRRKRRAGSRRWSA